MKAFSEAYHKQNPDFTVEGLKRYNLDKQRKKEQSKKERQAKKLLQQEERELRRVIVKQRKLAKQEAHERHLKKQTEMIPLLLQTIRL